MEENIQQVKPIENIEKNKILAGISYLFLFLGWIGMIINCIIHYKSKNSYAKFHAGQACFLVLIIVVIGIIISLAMRSFFILNPFGVINQFSFSSGIILVFAYIYALVTYGLYIVLAIMAFLGKNFRIPIAADLLEK